jgi:phage N-6-adenine-methyltransferase
VNPGHYTSDTDAWATPPGLFAAINAHFHFDTDVCATAENAKCANYFTPEQNGLSQTWVGTCWMNPPYGREIGTWVKKAADSARENGATVVCLLPARTDTGWWHAYCLGAEVHFIRKRIRFGKAKTGAPFPSALVVFRPRVAWAFDDVHASGLQHDLYAEAA